MTRRTFTAADQLDFAALSGDFNPLHVDPVHARRLMFGAPAVHGVHTLLWCLDQWAAQTEGPFSLRSLKATFARPLRVDQAVEMTVRKDDGGKVRLLATSGADTIARIDFQWEASAPATTAVKAASFAAAAPVEHHAYDGLEGTLPLALDPPLAARLLPRLAARLAPEQVAAVLATTRLVGMESPGLHSVFSELDLTFTGAGADPIAWSVTQADTRFGLVVMELRSPSLEGEVRAFIRPAPRKQLSFAAARGLVPVDAFAGQRAVVVGGSRGLGEVAVKLLAAGGAEVMATYHQGAADAQSLVNEISAGGGAAASASLNVLDPGAAGDDLAGWAPTHLYYFATPFIATGPRGGFLQSLFETFSAYYVSGFTGTVNRFDGPQLKGVFSPSSVFVEDAPDTLIEYATAKAAGEYVADLLQKRRPELRVSRPRLPKMDTDQTATLGEGQDADPAPVILRELLDFARP
ncbi:MaoC/PaaZ C-terminal domain-containing protein [Brevundimonas lenta]|uniref:Acyl dehydratase n=1 Tax=Brevundimonas lenta TaxID=424796 RepID=A0A7W6NQN9_9CAUL|nr:MaoC/PaaZ C-terminal domain-containing protein [Brevundimonas lenta]MBB4084123.1 acyl dehydratase [Brevundimonas lenta]